MPNVAAALREEMQRLARKEVKQGVEDVKRQNAELKKTVSHLKKRVDSLEKELRRRYTPPQVKTASGSNGALPGSHGKVERARVTGAMIRGIRQRLGLTQAELAKLLGVSSQSVYQWESVDGRLNLRSRTKSAVVEIRSFGKREAQERLEQITGRRMRPKRKSSGHTPGGPETAQTEAEYSPNLSPSRLCATDENGVAGASDLDAAGCGPHADEANGATLANVPENATEDFRL